MGCDTNSLYKSIEACPGKKVLPGIRRRLYYIPKSGISVFPGFVSEPTGQNATMEGLAQLKGDFTLKADNFWKFIDLKDDASNATFESAGEDGSKIFNNQANAIVVGMEDDVKGLARLVNNDDVVYLFQQRDGKFCLLGNEMFKTHTTPSGDTASEITGAITTTFAIQVYDDCPIPTYKGKIMIEANKYIDAADGKEKTDTPQ